MIIVQIRKLSSAADTIASPSGCYLTRHARRGASLYRVVRSPDKYATVTFLADLQRLFLRPGKATAAEFIRLKLIAFMTMD